MPVAKITKTFVDTTPFPTKGQVIYMDKDLPGFGVIFGTKVKTYIAQKDVQGRSIRCSIGRHGHFTPEEARKLARDKLHLMASGINPNQQAEEKQAKAITLEQTLESYLKTRKTLKSRTREDYKWHFSKYLSDWKPKLISEIKKDMVVARHAHIAETSGPSTANKTMRLLRAMHNHASVTFDIETPNPVMILTRSRGWYKEKRRSRCIKPHELKKWWEAVHQVENDTYKDYLILLLFTGMRRNEAASLKWSDIDFKDRTLRIEDTKNSEPLVLPISDYIHGMLLKRKERYDILAQERGGINLFVFPGPGKHGYLAEPKKGVYEVIRLSGIEFSCHDLRRSFVSIAESMDLSGYTLKRLINHKMGGDVTGGYVIISVDRLRQPVEKIAQFILEKVADGKEESGEG